MGLGPGKRPDPHLQIPPPASPPAPAREGHGKQLAATALGNPVSEKAAPPGTLANAVGVVRERVTTRFHCCTPPPPLAHGNYRTVPPPPPEHNKQSQTGYSLTTEVNLSGSMGRTGSLKEPGMEHT